MFRAVKISLENKTTKVHSFVEDHCCPFIFAPVGLYFCMLLFFSSIIKYSLKKEVVDV